MSEGETARGIHVLPDRSGAWLLVDKPAGMTSRDVVNAVTRVTGIRKTGHAGTLDPMATGLLVVGIGRGATKQLGDGLAGEKAYAATARIGLSSPTHDVDTAVFWEVSTRPISEAEVQAALARIAARGSQVPPLVSALKVRGQALHKVARHGWWLPREARDADIHSIELESWQSATREARFRITGGGGLYVRSIVRDLGAALGSPAALTTLRRTHAGPYDITEAIPLDELDTRWRSHGITLE